MWDSAAANMRMYLLLQASVQRRSAPTPRWSRRWRRPGSAELAKPTLNSGETVADLVADRSTFEDFDADKAG